MGLPADLAFDDASHDRLRDMLQGVHRAGKVHGDRRTAFVAQNGVQYRIRKAEDSLCGRIDDCRADLELALRTGQYPGHALFGALDSGLGRRAKHSIKTTVCMCVLIIFTTERRTHVR
jgi:hypothetical protein